MGRAVGVARRSSYRLPVGIAVTARLQARRVLIQHDVHEKRNNKKNSSHFDPAAAGEKSLSCVYGTRVL